MDNITHLTDKELSEKRVELLNRGKEITNKENQTDEDLAKIKDYRKQIDNIDAERSKRTRKMEEINENKQYFAKEAQADEQRAGTYGTFNPHISQTIHDGYLNEIDNIIYEYSSNIPNRNNFLSKSLQRTSDCFRAGGVSKGIDKEYALKKDMLQAAYNVAKLGKVRLPWENRAESFGLLSENSNIIPQTVSNEIISQAVELANILNLCTVRRISELYKVLIEDSEGDSIKIFKAEELQEVESHIPKIKPSVMDGTTFRSRALMSNDLLAQVPFDYVGQIFKKMGIKFAQHLEDSLFNPAKFDIENADVFGFSGVTNEIESEGSKTVTYHDMVRMMHAVPEPYRKNSVFMMNSETLYMHLYSSLDSVGRPMFIDDISKSGFVKFIARYPVILADCIDNVESGKHPIYFGDLEALEVKIGRDLELDSEKIKSKDGFAIYGVLRYDARIFEPYRFVKLKIKE